MVATTDAAKGLKVPGLSKLNHSAMGKCSSLRVAAGRPKAAETIQAVTVKTLKYPCPTRWNSMFDSTNELLALSSSKLNELMHALKLPAFKEVDIEFIE